MLQIFRLDWFLEPLLFHSSTYPAFRSSIPLPLPLFFSSFFLSRQIFVPLSDFIDYTSRCNVLNDCFPISTEFCYFNQLLTLRYYQSRDVSFYLYIYIQKKKDIKCIKFARYVFFPSISKIIISMYIQK